MFLRSYLSNRHHYTAINDLSSTLRKVQCRAPQGSVLGPLLFALYINDIQNAVGAECMRLFADDTALYMVNADLKVLISSVKVKIQQLFKRCICNKLTINIDKTYFVLFHTINEPVPDGFTEIATTHMTTSTVYWCIASKLKAPWIFYWMSNIFLWVELFLFFVCYHVVPKRHSQLDYELNGL